MSDPSPTPAAATGRDGPGMLEGFRSLVETAEGMIADGYRDWLDDDEAQRLRWALDEISRLAAAESALSAARDENADLQIKIRTLAVVATRLAATCGVSDEELCRTLTGVQFQIQGPPPEASW